MSKYICLLFCLLMCVSTVRAKSDYFYYYKDRRIPLIVNNNKVCVSICKDHKNVRERLLENVKFVEQIKDEAFDIFIVSRSDYEKLTLLDSWEKDVKSILLTPSYKTIDNTEVFSTPYLTLRLKNEQDKDILTSCAEKYALKIVKQNPYMPLWYILSITSDTGKNALEIANILWESGKFAASAPDLSTKKMLCSTDPMFNQQWGLHNSDYPGIDISVNSAWNYTTGKDVKIAIFDTGVELDHIDLSANIYNLSYDAETDTSPSRIYSDHGTHCAGIAAAVKDNGIQIAGVAPESTIISISYSFPMTTCNPLKIANGIIWAYQHGADIISNSWYSPVYNQAIDEAISEAFTYGRQGKGCVVVFAAGNYDGDCISYPANCNDTILVVGAITNTGARAFYSDYGNGLDVVAPGEYILSTVLDNQIDYNSGTSMACPHVAGVAALILERNSELTVNQVNSIINSNAKKLSGVNFNVTKPDGLWNNEYGYGLVDAYNSVINTPSTVYIQNDTITGTKILLADNIYVGRDVTNTQEYGDVTLGQGNITLRAKNVVIKNSTTVPLSTTLKIEN